MSTGDFGCRWDSGQVGIIFVTPDDIRSEFDTLNDDIKEKAKSILESEVKVYDQHLRGQVWGYEVWKNCESCNQTEEVVDSCWGFLGEDLDDTGIEHHLADDIKPLLNKAWENRV